MNTLSLFCTSYNIPPLGHTRPVISLLDNDVAVLPEANVQIYVLFCAMGMHMKTNAILIKRSKQPNKRRDDKAQEIFTYEWLKIVEAILCLNPNPAV